MSLYTQNLMQDMQALHIMGQHRELKGVEINSRRVQLDFAFFCLQGNTDGHRFIPQALDAGARMIIIQNDFVFDKQSYALCQKTQVVVVSVSNTTTALQQAAIAHRKRVFDGKMIGITGSNGKTSCKEMLATMLSTIAPTLSTHGNFNNHLGVPLTLLRLKPEHQFAVVEMGMNAPGEIAQLAQWAEVEIGCIISIASAHLEGLGSVEAVAQAKGEMFASLAKSPVGHAFYHEDLPCLPLILPNTQAQLHSLSSQQLTLQNIQHLPQGSQASIDYLGHTYTLQLQSVGIHQLNNARLMLSIALYCGGDIRELLKALSTLKTSLLRGEVRHLKSGMTLWIDCYNANPQSMMASLQAFRASGFHGCLVLGEIKELGDHSDMLHADLGRQIASLYKNHHILIYTIGDEAYPLHQALLNHHYPKTYCRHFSLQEIEKVIPIIQATHPAAVFLKGSRSTRLERIATALTDQSL